MASSNISSNQVRVSVFYRQVARLHIEGISQGFLPQLGLEFMTILYDAIDHSSNSVLITESHDGEVIGFVAGASSMRPIYRQLLRKPIRLFIALLPSLIMPQRVRRIFEILRYNSQMRIAQVTEVPGFELLSIVVAPAARGTGAADRLYQRLVEHCEKKSLTGFKIVVGDALAPAHRFYQRNGAIPVGRIEVHLGEGSVIYVHRITSNRN